jgi:hypothetical protein
MNAGATRQRGAVAWATLICAVIASLAVAVAPAAAEGGGAGELPVYDGPMLPRAIQGPGEPEEFSYRVELAPHQMLVEVDETEAEVRYEDGVVAFAISPEPSHDATGATVPTTLRVSGGDVLTYVVHDQDGNPAAGGAPFVYPITAGLGWDGGSGETVIVKGPPDEKEIAEELRIAEEIRRAEQRIREASPAAATTGPPAPTCKIPSLDGFSLHGAKSRLRAAHCAIGRVHLAAGASAGKGKVVKQFRPAGTQLAAGAPVAVKLGSR